MTGGLLKSGANVELLPTLAHAKVRGLQSHGESVDEVALGDRAAVNLSQIEKGALKRGSQLAEKGFLKPSKVLGISFSLLERTERRVKHQQRVRLHIGTEEVLGRIFFVEEGRKKCEAGETTVALVRLEQEVAAAVDDSFILRFYSPAETIGGGTIVDPAPPVRLKAARPWLAGLVNKSSDERLEKFFEQAASEPLTLSEWTRRWQVSLKKFTEDSSHLETIQFGNSGDPYLTLQSVLDGQMESYLSQVEGLLKKRSTRRGVPQEDLRKSLGFSRPLFDWLTGRLQDDSKVQMESGDITLRGYTVTLSKDDEAISHKLRDILKTSGYAPPVLVELAEEAGANGTDIVPLLHILKDRGETCQVSSKLWYHNEVMNKLQNALKSSFGDSGGFNVGQFKKLTNTSRKHAIPLLEYLDSQRFTDRDGDRRVFLS